MGQIFDPYYKWLGIPPEEQPANHYRLLGIRIFESDADVIQAAADQRMAHLRNYQAGKNSELSQRLLNEVAAARVCLLNAEKKAAYDEQLRAKQAASRPAPKPIEPEQSAVQPLFPSGAGLSDMLDEMTVLPKAPIRTRTSFGRAKRPVPVRLILVGIGIFGVFLALVNLTGSQSQVNPPVETAVKPQPPPIETPRPQPKKTERSETPKVQYTDVPAESLGTAKPSPPAQPTAPSQPSEQPSEDAAPPAKKLARAVLKLEPSDTTSRTQPDSPAADPKKSKSAARSPCDAEPSKSTGDSVASDAGRETAAAKAPPRRRVSMPSVAEQEKAMRLAEELFKDDLAKAKTTQEKMALARKFFDQAQAMKNADADAFVLYQMAKDLSIQCTDGVAAFGVVDALAERYQIDPGRMKADVLREFLPKARTSAQKQAIAEQAVQLMDAAAAAGDFGLAVAMAEMTVSEDAGRGKELAKRAKACLSDFQKAEEYAAAFEKVKGKLAQSPDDAEANLAAARYYAFVKNDWTEGLRYLAKSSDATLAFLARRELESPPQNVEDQIDLADHWWKAAEGAPDGVAKLAFLRHARAWYEKAQAASAGGLQTVKINKRLDEIAKAESESALAGAASRTFIPFNQWFRLLLSPKELFGWETEHGSFTYANGIIELQEGLLLCPIEARDAGLRAKVQFPKAGSCVCLVLRHSDAGCYAAVIEDALVKIVRLRYNSPSYVYRYSGWSLHGSDVLAEKFIRPIQPGAVFLFGFEVGGDTLTAYLNGQAAVQVKDSSYAEGAAGLGALRRMGAALADVELFLPGRAALVEDRRVLPESLRGVGAVEFKFPAGR